MADGPWTKYSAPAASGGGNAMPWEKYGGTTAEAAPVDQNAVPDLNSPQAQQQAAKFGTTGYYLTPAEAAQAGNDQRPMLDQLMHPVGGWSGAGRRVAASLSDQGRALGNMFGLGDRAAATVEGDGATYTDRLRAQQAATAEAMHRLGALGTVQDIAGSTAGATAVLPEALMGGGASLLGKVGYGALGGGVTGAVAGATQTPADASGSDMLNNAAMGAGIGAVTGGAIPAVAHGIGAVLGPSVAGPGQDAIAAGQRQGINVPVIAGSDSPLVQLAGQGLGGTFVGSAVPQSLQKMGSDIGARVQGIAKEAGTPNIPNVMGGDLRAGVTDYIKTGSQVPAKAAFDARDALVPPGATVLMPNTQQGLAKIKADRIAAGDSGLGAGMDPAAVLAALPDGAIPAGLQRAKSKVGLLQQTGPASEGYDKGDLKFLFGKMAQDQNDFYAGKSPPIDPNALNNTRGGGVQYHGTGVPDLQLDSSHYSSKNYYGQGFYTTDAVDIARGYAKARAGSPSLYQVAEKNPVKLLDAEAPLSPDLRKIAEGADYDGIVEQALGENPKNLRELYDGIRQNGTAEGHSADTIQEVFDSINYNLQNQGYGGISHLGGLKTGKEAHRVAVYFDPERDININSRDYGDFKPTPRPVPAPGALDLHLKGNALYAKAAQRNQELTDKLLGPGKSDEQLFSTVAGAAQAGGRANVKLLMQVKGAVPQAHWNDFSASVINKLGLNNKGDFSPTIFLNNWQGKNGIADPAKNILFTPAHRDALDDLAKMSVRYDNLSKLANNSKTGNVNSVIGFATGILHAPIAALTAAFGGNQMARMLARPATVKTVTGWSQAYGNFMKNGGQAAAQDLSKWTKNLSVTLATELGDARQAPAIEQKLLQMKPMAQADDGAAPN